MVELETQLRGLKLERVRLLQDLEALLSRGRRFLQEEAPEMFPSAEPPRRPADRERDRDLDRMDPLATVPGMPRGLVPPSSVTAPGAQLAPPLPGSGPQAGQPARRVLE